LFIVEQNYVRLRLPFLWWRAPYSRVNGTEKRTPFATEGIFESSVHGNISRWLEI